MSRVVQLTTVHQPHDVRIFHKQAVSLAQAGFAVTLIACAAPKETRQGVSFRSLPKAKNRWERMTITAWRAYRAALAEKAILYHFHDPELIPVGLLLKLSGKKVIYDVHEDVAKDIVDKKYIPRLIRPLVQAVVRGFEWLAAVSFDRIVAATASIARNFPARKATLVRNVPIGEELLQPDPKPFHERPRQVVYIGGLAPFNGVRQMVEAMGMLPAEANIRLVLAGKFVSPQDEATICQLPGWARVDYHGWIGREKIPALFGQARAALVVYQPTPNIMECEPNKFFEVLSAGLPLIASTLPHWQRFIEEHRCGIAVDPTSTAAIAAAILKLVNDPDQAEKMGRSGRMAVARDYNWATDAARLVALYHELLGPTC